MSQNVSGTERSARHGDRHEVAHGAQNGGPSADQPANGAGKNDAVTGGTVTTEGASEGELRAAAFWKKIVVEWGPNAELVAEMFRQFLASEQSVSKEWQRYFRSLQEDAYAVHSLDSLGSLYSLSQRSPSQQPHSSAHVKAPEVRALSGDRVVSEDGALRVQQKIGQLVSAHRARGHFKARINPLRTGVQQIAAPADLSLEYYGFSDEEIRSVHPTAGFRGDGRMTLNDLYEALSDAYCGTVGFEFSHLLDREERAWLEQQIEHRFEQNYHAHAQEKHLRLQRVVSAELFEDELHKKYVGNKRFSLQGGDSLIAMLDALLLEAHDQNVAEVVFGMAHRGRLNVLANTFGKPLKALFAEFEDQSLFAAFGYGDVKYHLGFESDYSVGNGRTVHLSLVPNPSHLEFVNPVIEGVVRAKQDRYFSADRTKVVPLLLHGDAAVIGQGIVYETLNLSQIPGYRTGGTVHVVINNQVGFTTTPDESRSSVYCTDMAKAVGAPVFHVNAEDVDAACWTMRTALKFRQRYRRDVVVDLYCYRKYGHNEGDDPSFTQPLMYKEIAEKEAISEIYARKLVNEGVISPADLENYRAEYKQRFQDAYRNRTAVIMGEACPTHGRLRVPTPDTGVTHERLKEVARQLVTYPEDFTVHPKLFKILQKRVESVDKGERIEWGLAEGLAYGSLVQDGCNVRLSGQDCGRGTFSQRHLLLDSYDSDRIYNPLAGLHPNAKFEILNSPLSEAAVLGFEFGFASVRQQSLVLWEAQFGDFVNGAQVIIDQFLAASEAKWAMRSGVALLLPHGYEGQGPEHSSARLERFLQLAADGNMVVCYPSQAGQYFHLLRRQGLLDIKRPMVIMTPKSLLRSADASCALSDLIEGQFQTVLVDDRSQGEERVDVICCAGKVYYDIVEALKGEHAARLMVVRFEQLYPFPQFEVKKALQGKSIRKLVWVQEEPQNMGAWSYIEPYLRKKLGAEPVYIGRPVSASTATGSPARHYLEQRTIINGLLDEVRDSH